MTETVHILATVRKPELRAAALLVFRSLRTGFPTVPVHVWGNNLSPNDATVVRNVSNECQAEFRQIPFYTPHDWWIENLLLVSNEPFWICDTDIVFWQKVESFFSKESPVYAGRYQPEWHEEWMDTQHVARLHTCLMYLDPVKVRMVMRAWSCRIPPPCRGSAEFPFIRMTFVPRLNQIPLCYDTLAGLYQAVPGMHFTEEQNACFDHLGCANYADAIKIKGVDLEATHRAIFEQPELAKGIREQHEKYYLAHRINGDKNVKGALCH